VSVRWVSVLGMASIRTWNLADGGRSYTVSWRDPELKKVCTRTFRQKDRAEALKLYLDANQNTLSLARESKRKSSSTEPTVWDTVLAYLNAKRQTPSTETDRRNMLRHLQGTELAGTMLSEVRSKDIQDWLAGIMTGRTRKDPDGHPAPWKTRSNLHTVVSAALSTEVGKGLKENPARGALGKRDELPTREPVDLTLEELRMLRDRAAIPADKLLIHLITASGLRWGEASELRRKDLHRMEDGRIILRVRRAWTNGRLVGLTKTSMSRRDIPLRPDVSAALWHHVDGSPAGALVFPGPLGDNSALSNSYFHKRCWQPLTRKLVAEGKLMEKPWIHDLRHSHCAHLLRAGVRPSLVQKRLGHEDIATTLRIYDMISTEDDLTAADAITW